MKSILMKYMMIMAGIRFANLLLLIPAVIIVLILIGYRIKKNRSKQIKDQEEREARRTIDRILDTDNVHTK